jgi:hypothetical protein
MGGFGSGEHNRTTRATVERCYRFTVADARRLGLAARREDKTVAEVFVVRERQWIRLSTTEQPAGGRRWWLRCSLCDGRARRLYRPPSGSEWRCRRCWDLGYNSRRLTAVDAALRQAAHVRWPLKLAAILEGKLAECGRRTVPRPYRMRHATYWRTLTRANEYELKAYTIVLDRIRRRSRQRERA